MRPSATRGLSHCNLPPPCLRAPAGGPSRRRATALHSILRRLVPALSLILGFPYLSSVHAEAQYDPGGIAGTVAARTTSVPLAGVYIQILDTSSQAVTDQAGSYSIDEVPPGIYSVGFDLPGYRTLIRTNVSVAPGRTTELSVSLDAEMAIQSELRVYEINELTVEGEVSYFETDPDIEVSGRSISSDEILSASGAMRDIQRVVQILPSVTTGSDQMNEIIVRGGNYGENLFLLDGLEIPNPNHFAYQGAGGGPISILSAETIRDVNFIAGAFPARYGDKASSVLDITLRKGARDRRLVTFDTSMGGIGGILEGPIGKGGTYLVSGNRSYLELIASGFGLTAVPKYGSLQSKVSYDVGRHTFLWNTLYSTDHIEIESDDEDEDFNVDFDSGLVMSGATLKSLFGRSLHTELALSHVRNLWDYTAEEGAQGRSLDRISNRSTESETQIKGHAAWSPGSYSLSGGFSVKNSRFEHDIDTTPDTTFIFDTDFASADDDTIIGVLDDHPAWRVHRDVNAYKNAVYGQFRFSPLRRLTLRLGGRYDWMDFTDESHLSPRVAIRLALSNTLWLSSAYGIHYQSPAYLALTAHENNRDNLDSYYTEQLVVGTEWLPRPDTRVTLEGYAKEYRDVPVAKEWLTPDPWDDFDGTGELVNAAEGRSEGIELYIQRKKSTSYSYILSLSLYRARFKDPRTGEERPWDFDHRRLCTLSVSKHWRLSGAPWYENMKDKLWYRFFRGFLPFGDEVELSARWRFAGGRPYTRPEYLREYHTWITPADAPLNADRHPDYHRLDIRLDRHYYRKNMSLTVYFDLMNVYGRKNIWGYSYDGNGEVDRVNQFSTIPFVGLSIKF